MQSLLHLRIHAALQKIEHSDAQDGRNLLRKELAQKEQELVSNEDTLISENEDTSISENEDDFFDAEEDCVNMTRHDSNSSFDIISDDELNGT